MPQIPRELSLDSTLAFRRDPYRFISRRCDQFRSDLFQTRLLLQETICMRGAEAARLFYDPARFIRQGAMPEPIRKTLLGQGGVQTLDADAHRVRKHMFLTLMTPERIDQLLQQVAAEWQASIARWASMPQVLLYDELHRILTRAVCAWAGVPLLEGEVDARTREITALFEHAGSASTKHLWSRQARRQTESWLAACIGQIRSGAAHPPEASAAHAVAWHRGADGALLSPKIAAVELLNVLRPTVAVSVYIVFIAHALHAHTQAREKLEAGERDYLDLFVQEVRRFYPFFPGVAARVRQTFEWQGYMFPEGQRVILDLHGTNHDPRTWDKPGEFQPERFRQWDGSAFNFIPQGGADHATAHRCPGEWITIALMKQATDILARQIRYDVPPQDLQIMWSWLPALPQSRFVIANVKAR